MALTCCFCGQTVGSRTARYPVESDFDHVMCADCSSALDCVRSSAQSDSSYRNQAINYFRQKLDLGLVEPSMKDFLIRQIAGSSADFSGRTERRSSARVNAEGKSVRPENYAGTPPAQWGNDLNGENKPVPSGNSFWIIACRVLLIFLCVMILIASEGIGVFLLVGQGMLGLSKDLAWAFLSGGILVSFVILSVGMLNIEKARDLHMLRKYLIPEKRKGA